MMVNSPECSFLNAEDDRSPNYSASATIGAVPSPYGILHQAILRQIPTIARSDARSVPQLSSTVVAAMQRLVEAIASSSTRKDGPSSAPISALGKTNFPGFRGDRPFPNTVLGNTQLELASLPDEIQERAADVLLALAQPVEKHPATTLFAIPATTLVSLKDLAPWLLWGIARSAYGAMRLLEGTTARILQPDQSWQPGILRLVAMLEIKTPQFSCTWDAVTQQATLELLGSDRLLQFGDVHFGQEPTSIHTTLNLLTEQITQITPALIPFFQGIHTEILVPQYVWQPAWIKLHLGFEFSAALPSSLTFNPQTDIFKSDTKLGIPKPDAFPRTDAPVIRTDAPVVKFTHADWKAHYAQVAAQQQVVDGLSSLPSLQNDEPDLADLVADAYRIVHRQRTCLTLTSRNFIQQELQLDELALRLLWCFSHSAYEVMQLMSGIPIQLLQPQGNWDTGILRLSIRLELQTPELDWCLDLITGQSPEMRPIEVSLNSVVRSPEVDGMHQPMLLESLQNRVRQHLAQNAPELLLLMEGAEVDLLEHDLQWQPGGIRLSTDFEFISDLRSAETPQ